MKRAIPLMAVGIVISLTACSPDEESDVVDLGTTTVSVTPPDDLSGPVLPDNTYNYADPNLPAHFRTNVVQGFNNTPGNNPVTDEGATLGRVLFYDKALSANFTISCASCHQQSTGFTDPDQFSTGFAGGLTGRNSMGLANSHLYERGRFFWDERAPTLEDQVLGPIQDAVEMGMDLETLVARLNEIDYYPALFEDAFGTSEINSTRISFALAQFVRSMVSYQSRYDEGIEQTGNLNQPFPNFTAAENQGKQVFIARCANCHTQNGPGPGNNQNATFHVLEPFNIGLDATTTDAGLAGATGNPQDEGKFKPSSLRNIALAGPYMHDGRFETLEEVIEFYNSGVQAHPNLAAQLRAPGPGGPGGAVNPVRMNLTDAQKNALKAFLVTLNDNEFISDPKFSDPFPQ